MGPGPLVKNQWCKVNSLSYAFHLKKTKQTNKKNLFSFKTSNASTTVTSIVLQYFILPLLLKCYVILVIIWNELLSTCIVFSLGLICLYYSGFSIILLVLFWFFFWMKVSAKMNTCKCNLSPKLDSKSHPYIGLVDRNVVSGLTSMLIHEHVLLEWNMLSLFLSLSLSLPFRWCPTLLQDGASGNSNPPGREPVGSHLHGWGQLASGV